MYFCRSMETLTWAVRMGYHDSVVLCYIWEGDSIESNVNGLGCRSEDNLLSKENLILLHWFSYGGGSMDMNEGKWWIRCTYSKLECNNIDITMSMFFTTLCDRVSERDE